MKYLLDTNVCVQYINGRSLQIRAKVLRTPIDEIVVCSIVQAEMFHGAYKSDTPDITLAKRDTFFSRYRSLDFDTACTRRYGMIRATLEKRGTPIGTPDMMVAAIALVHDLILVTHNVAEFSRVDGLKIEDWEL